METAQRQLRAHREREKSPFHPIFFRCSCSCSSNRRCSRWPFRCCCNSPLTNRTRWAVARQLCFWQQLPQICLSRQLPKPLGLKVPKPQTAKKVPNPQTLSISKIASSLSFSLALLSLSPPCLPRAHAGKRRVDGCQTGRLYLLSTKRLCKMQVGRGAMGGLGCHGLSETAAQADEDGSLGCSS